MIRYRFHNDSPFFSLLKQKVDGYFGTRNLKRDGGRKLMRKGIIQFASAAVLYTTLVFFTPGVVLSVILCILLGLSLAIIGFNIMHEGGHQSFSKHLWINEVSAYFLNILGGNSYYWKIKHNINHHTYTNIEGLDSDIDVRPFMRMHKDQPLHPFHRFQHIYWVLLYGISYLVWVFYEDFQKYFSGRISKRSSRKKLPVKEHLIFWASKIFYVSCYIIIPVLVTGWLSWLIGFMIVTFVCGLAISIVFQLAHVVEGTQFHPSDATHRRQDWAVHQVISTSNFATSSKTLHWLLGGLNFQIEHHLFPRISHIHYPAISQFVKQACAECGIVYNEFTSVFNAIRSHILHLHRLGRLTP